MHNIIKKYIRRKVGNSTKMKYLRGRYNAVVVVPNVFRFRESSYSTIQINWFSHGNEVLLIQTLRELYLGCRENTIPSIRTWIIDIFLFI